MRNRKSKAKLMPHSIKEKKASVGKPKKFKTKTSILSHAKKHSGAGLVVPDSISKIIINVNGVNYYTNNNHKDNNVVFMDTVSKILGR